MDFINSPNYKDVFELATRLPEKEIVRLQKELSKRSATKLKTKKLTTKDVALGIGRKATDEELKEYFTRTSKTNTKTYTEEEVEKSIRLRLTKRNKKV